MSVCKHQVDTCGEIYILNPSMFVKVRVYSCATGRGHWEGILCKMQVVAALCELYYAITWLCYYMQAKVMSCTFYEIYD
jgi:hypothetical protein